MEIPDGWVETVTRPIDVCKKPKPSQPTDLSTVSLQGQIMCQDGDEAAKTFKHELARLMASHGVVYTHVAMVRVTPSAAAAE